MERSADGCRQITEYEKWRTAARLEDENRGGYDQLEMAEEP